MIVNWSVDLLVESVTGHKHFSPSWITKPTHDSAYHWWIFIPRRLLLMSTAATITNANHSFSDLCLLIESLICLSCVNMRHLASTNGDISSHSKKMPNNSKRQSSGNREQRSSQLKNTSRTKVSQEMASSSGQNALAQIQSPASAIGVNPAFNASSSKKGAEPMASYDPARISQWQAQSAIDPSVTLHYGMQDHTYLDNGSNVMLAGVPSQMQSHFPVLESTVPGAFDSSPSNVPHAPEMPYHACTTSAEATFSPMGMDFEMPNVPGLDFSSALNGDVYHTGFCANTNHDSYAAFPANEFSLDPLEMDPSLLFRSNDNGGGPSLSWDQSGAGIMQPLEWSSASGLTPSCSSVQSASSFLGHQPDTPLSGTMCDAVFNNGQPGAMESGNGMFPLFNLGGDSTALDLERFAIGTYTLPGLQSNFTYRTLRPVANFQRPALPMDLWSGPELAGQSGIPVSYSRIDGARRSSEGEAKSARAHHYYQATPKEDGLYHCPYTASDKCSHRPDKLKCNYE